MRSLAYDRHPLKKRKVEETEKKAEGHSLRKKRVNHISTFERKASLCLGNLLALLFFAR